MPPAVQLQVFNRSFSTKGPGRGLGTYSVKLLSEQYLGAEVDFTSESGHGTRFVVSLPKAPE
jgi:signal transduction histidine kinase